MLTPVDDDLVQFDEMQIVDVNQEIVRVRDELER